MAAGDRSATFKAIADFGKLIREAKLSQKEMRALKNEVDGANKKLKEQEEESEKTARGLARVAKGAQTFSRRLKDAQSSNFGKKLDDWGNKTKKLTGNLLQLSGKLAVISLIGVAATASVGPILSLVGGIAALSGAAGVLPGLIGALGAAGVVLKVAFMGAGDALKAAAGPADEFEDAIKDMPAGMQEFARAAREVMPELRNIKETIQNNFWKGLGKPIRELADQYLPMLRDQGGRLATTFNKAAKEAASFFKQKDVADDLDGSLSNINKMWENMVAAVKPLLRVFVDLFAVSSEFLPGMGKGIAGATTRFADFIHTARESGKLKQWIQGGIDALKALWDIIWNIGRAFKAVFTAGTAEGNSFFQTLAKLTDKLADFLESARGQDSLRKLFEAASQAADILEPIIKALFNALADVIPVLVKIGEKVGPGVTAVINGIAKAVKVAEPSLVKLGTAIGGFLKALGDAGPFIGRLAAGIADVLSPIIDALAWLIRTLTGLFNALPGPIQSVIGSMGGIVIVAGLAALAIVKLLGIGAGIVGTFGKATTALSKFIGVVNKIPGVNLPGAPSTGEGGDAAGKGKKTPKGPKGGPAGGAGQLSLFPDLDKQAGAAGDKSSKSFLSRLGSGIKKGAGAVGGAVKSLFSGAGKAASAAGSGMAAAFSWAKTGLATVIKGIASAIVVLGGALKALGVWLLANPIVLVIAAIAAAAYLIITNWDTVKQWIATFWGWLQAGFQAVATVLKAVWTAIATAVTTAWNAIVAFLTPAFEALKAIWQAFWNGPIGQFIQLLWGTIVAVVTTAVNAVKAVIEAVLAVIKAVWDLVWNTISNTVMFVWNLITGNIDGALQNLKNIIGGALTFIKDIWNAAWKFVSDIVSAVWGGIEDIIGTAIDWISGAIEDLFGAFQWLADQVKGILDWIERRVNDVKNFVTGSDAVVIGQNPGNIGGGGKNGGFGKKKKGGQIGGRGNGDRRMILAESGEYVVPRKTTKDWLPLLRALNPYDHGGLTVDSVLGNMVPAAPAPPEVSVNLAMADHASGERSGVRDVHVTQIVNNPLPEKPSETASKKTSRAARLGVMTVLNGVA